MEISATRNNWLGHFHSLSRIKTMLQTSLLLRNWDSQRTYCHGTAGKHFSTRRQQNRLVGLGRRSSVAAEPGARGLAARLAAAREPGGEAGPGPGTGPGADAEAAMDRAERQFRERVRRFRRTPPPPSWWTVPIENSYRLALADYVDEEEYLRHTFATGVEKWPTTGLIKKLERRSDGCFYYYGETRECPDVEPAVAAAVAAYGTGVARWRPLPRGRMRLVLVSGLAGLGVVRQGTAPPPTPLTAPPRRRRTPHKEGARPSTYASAQAAAPAATAAAAAAAATAPDGSGSASGPGPAAT